MRILGVDYGDVRVGLAFVDTDVIAVPVPLSVFRNDATLFPSLRAMCKERGVDKLLVGLPRTLRGEEGMMARKIRRFAKKLSVYVKVPVVFFDERLSTKSISAALPERDALVAASLLAAWLARKQKSR